MSISLQTGQTVAHGPFNPLIITPEWLVANRVCDSGPVEHRLMSLNQEVSFALKGVTWHVDLRLLLATSRAANCGRLVSQVMNHLKHTPVRAVENNFRYACTREEWGSAPLPFACPIEQTTLEQTGVVEQSRWGCVLNSNGVRIEATVVSQDPGVVVFLGFSRETKTNAEAQAAAEMYETDRNQSRLILEKWFGQRVPA